MKKQKTLKIFACDNVQVRDSVFCEYSSYLDVNSSAVISYNDIIVFNSALVWKSCLARGPSVFMAEFLLNQKQFA